jgi:hypothetical protein
MSEGKAIYIFSLYSNTCSMCCSFIPTWLFAQCTEEWTACYKTNRLSRNVVLVDSFCTELIFWLPASQMLSRTEGKTKREMGITVEYRHCRNSWLFVMCLNLFSIEIHCSKGSHRHKNSTSYFVLFVVKCVPQGKIYPIRTADVIRSISRHALT